MSSEGTPETSGQASAADASARPLSSSPDAVRKRQARASASSKTQTTSGGRGGAEPATKGNPMRPGDWSLMGEPLSPHEAERQLFYGHVAIGKALRSQWNPEELREEFQVAGENYAFVANKMWTPLRVIIRFIAPVVLVAVLLVIWGEMLTATPWAAALRERWARRGRQEEAAYADVQVEVQQPAHASNGAAAPAAQQAPPVPRRPAMVRRFSR